MNAAAVTSHLDAGYEQSCGELCEFLSIPSVSAHPRHRRDMIDAADWLVALLRRSGLAARIVSTGGHPLVLGHWRGAEGAPTVLLYGHYDVQPPDPLDEWTSPPFEPTLRDQRIYARGATDDKGQLFAHLKALGAWLTVHGRVPVNVVVLIEGEEEVGGSGIAAFVRAEAEELRCDAVVISDSAMIAPGVPTIETSLRGLAGVEIAAIGPRTDLHSGEYGGVVMNPAVALCRIVAGLQDAEGRITIDGFYAGVREWPAAEREALRHVPFSENAFLAQVDAPAEGGEAEYSLLERRWMRPSFDVTGMLSGYTGEGPKSVLPARAMAKLSFRLVPEQSPADVLEKIEAHVRSGAPAGIRIRVTPLGSARPWRTGRNSHAIRAAARAFTRAFNREPVFVGGGGSIPIVTDFSEVLGAPVVLAGFGSPGENAHAPNEWISEDHLRRGMHASACLWEELAAREAHPAVLHSGGGQAAEAP
ncbi:MAG TPA: dipeptidase [Vicinamibacterales bacterium]|nr:dipeptidase [Vicinamibacterales bacterium]